MNDTPKPAIADPALPGVVAEPTIQNLPGGYCYGVTRYADVILANSFPTLFAEIVHSLESFAIDFTEDIVVGGGGRANHTARFDQSLYDQGWQKHNVEIEKLIDKTPIFKTRSHEIDVFKLGEDDWYPGVAVEMEWNNKDPFYHRDLNNFSGLHNEGVIAVGVIITRGPRLQAALEAGSNAGYYPKSKYGRSTTHWDKLTPIVNLGGGGQCPLFLIGIQDERVTGWPNGIG
ncbi:MAG: BglII/BstYI family type II restriction endonuclease [Propionibacteriaceae bacterium]|nr:BglII/BstYI family type II restriction endonuclease [Propionibacteriaceae bacterium]